MAGVVMNTTVLGRALVEPDYEPIFAEMNKRSAVLYLHPAGNSACSPLIGEHYLTWMVGAPVEDTISVMHLITNGIPTRYPNIKIINSHLGGALPMLLQRVDREDLVGLREYVGSGIGAEVGSAGRRGRCFGWVHGGADLGRGADGPARGGRA